MALAREAPLISASPYAKKAGGLETNAPPKGPDPAAPPTPPQLSRVADLFIRGAISKELAETARRTQRDFGAVVGRTKTLPAAFLEAGVAAFRAACLLR